MILSNDQYAEKRNFIRLEVHTPLTFTLSDNEEPYDGISINLSGTGVLFKTKAPVMESQLIKMIISPQHGQFNPLHAEAKIIRIINENNSDQKTVACQLLTVE